jgi:ribosomal protein S18 acetylase RimI-like enzyme
MNIDFDIAKTENAREITELLNAVTLWLHQKSIMQWQYPWDQKVIEQDISQNSVKILLIDGRIIGTFSIKQIKSYPWASEIHDDFLYVYRIALHPDYQGKGIGRQIIQHAVHFGQTRKMNLFLNCWAGNNTLRKFYSNSGFEHIGDFPENDYQISAFCFRCK